MCQIDRFQDNVTNAVLNPSSGAMQAIATPLRFLVILATIVAVIPTAANANAQKDGSKKDSTLTIDVDTKSVLHEHLIYGKSHFVVTLLNLNPLHYEYKVKCTFDERTDEWATVKGFASSIPSSIIPQFQSFTYVPLMDSIGSPGTDIDTIPWANDKALTDSSAYGNCLQRLKKSGYSLKTQLQALNKDVLSGKGTNSLVKEYEQWQELESLDSSSFCKVDSALTADKGSFAACQIYLPALESLIKQIQKESVSLDSLFWTISPPPVPAENHLKFMDSVRTTLKKQVDRKEALQTLLAGAKAFNDARSGSQTMLVTDPYNVPNAKGQRPTLVKVGVTRQPLGEDDDEDAEEIITADIRRDYPLFSVSGGVVFREYDVEEDGEIVLEEATKSQLAAGDSSSHIGRNESAAARFGLTSLFHFRVPFILPEFGWTTHLSTGFVATLDDEPRFSFPLGLSLGYKNSAFLTVGGLLIRSPELDGGYKNGDTLPKGSDDPPSHRKTRFRPFLSFTVNLK